jgi:hypothetical protein
MTRPDRRVSPLWCSAMLLAWAAAAVVAGERIGADATAGCLASPRMVDRLEIDQSGVYENYLVDCAWASGNRVKITADDVVLRHCEIRHATGNGVGVFAANVTIEGCRIHHLLKGSFEDQQDAHGITGRPQKLVIRNCDIGLVSGDCLQFDPDRHPWGDVLVENCTLWTGPLPADTAGFKAGQRPGENAFDSKTPPDGPRPKITFRRCLFYGWNQPGQINLLAALNLKENVDAVVEDCAFRDCQAAFRLRGPGSRGGALVKIENCGVYDSAVAVRMEDALEHLTIRGLGFGPGVERRYHQVGGGPWPGYSNTGERELPPFDATYSVPVPATQ